MSIHTLQASDIPDDVVMQVIHETVAAKGHVGRIDVTRALWQYPKRVVWAKMRSMAKRGVISTCESPGCSCGSLIFLPDLGEWR